MNRGSICIKLICGFDTAKPLAKIKIRQRYSLLSGSKQSDYTALIHRILYR